MKAADTQCVNSPLFPRVAVIVPIAPTEENLEDHLRSLIRQDYPDYHILLVTQDEWAPVIPVIATLLEEHQSVRHVIAGKAVSCSQKNHNLVQAVQAADTETDILVFCDSGHFADPQWIGCLIAPLRNSSIAVSSGYHQIYPDKPCVTSIGRTICVHALNLVRRIPSCAQPWGGATAMRADDFRKLRIGELWSTTIVDDVTLADHLQKEGKTIAMQFDADLKTKITDTSWSAWESWLIRQWAYLKFVFPKLWLLAGLLQLAFTFLVCLSIVAVLSWNLQIFPDRFLYAAAVFLAAMIAGMLVFRSLHPAPGSLIVWFPASIVTLIMALWCHCRLWFFNSIVWAGITYKVAAGGKVLEIIHPEERDR